MAEPQFIIVATEAEAFGGAERSLVALSRWLHEQSLPHRFLLYRDQIGLARFADHPLDLVTLDPAGGPLKKIAAMRRYFQALPANAPRPLMSGIQSALHASLAGLRGFHTLMYDTPSLLESASQTSSVGRWIRQKVSNRALTWGLNSGGKTIVTGTYLRAEAEALWHPPVAIARMGGMGKATFRPRRLGTKLRMLSACRVETNKRIDWILRALAALESTSPSLHERVNWRLDIVGGGSQQSALEALSKQLGIGGSVTFHGFVSDEKLAEFYDRADLFLMPARQGYGIPAVEALARGIPVLLHRESGVSDLLLNTPWVTIIEGAEDVMPTVLDRAVSNFLRGDHLRVSLPDLPTEDQWAEQVARYCGWYSGR